MAVGPYLPVGMKITRDRHGQIKVMGVAAPPQFTQTYTARGRTVPNATVAAVAETVAADAPAGGTGANAGGYDTAANRDVFITRINQLRADLLALKAQQAALAARIVAIKGCATSIIDACQSTGTLMA